MTIAIILLMTLAPGQDSSMSLDQAIELLLERNPVVAAERAAARAAEASAGLASPAFLPSLAMRADAVRTTDPVAVFGMKLRQENFLAPDLTLDALNRPDAYGGFSFQASLQQPILALEGIFGYRAATRAARAREAMARRTSGILVNNLIRIYWGTQLAQAQILTLESAFSAARAHADQADALRTHGLTTGLDARLARVRAAEIEAQLISARAQADNARAALLSLIDLPNSTSLELSDPLALDGEADCETGTCQLRRADLDAATAAVEAATFAVKRAWSGNLPAVVAFANIASYRQNSFGGSSDWTVGIAVTWNPFRGTAGVAAINEARAQRESRQQRLNALKLQAELEVAQSTRLLHATRQRHQVALAALAEANEALIQANLRYATGISTITELLDVQSATNAANLNLLAAIHDILVARATLDFAYGVFDQ